MPITHEFVSAKTDGGDPTELQPSNWNDDHDLTGLDITEIPTVETDTDLVLAPDGTGGVEWVAPTGGGALYPLDTYSLDATYGDHFTAAALDAKWTRRNFVSETHQFGPAATHMRTDTTGRSAGDGYFQTAPAGDWTFAMKHIQWWGSGASAMAPCVIDSTGAGIMIQSYTSPDTIISAALSGYTYASSFTQLDGWNASYTSQPHREGLPMWTYIRKSGTNYYGAFSWNGETWSPETPLKNWTGTVDRVGMILPLGFAAAKNPIVDVDWFNKIA